MITLGGNIKLDGFDGVEPGMLIVVKKMVGLFAKKASESMGALDSFEVVKADSRITVRAVAKEKSVEGVGEAPNMFIALSNALKEVDEKAKH